MVSATDFTGKKAGADVATTKPPKRRFRLFAALAAPFKDVDDRAVKRREEGAIRNNSKGNLFTTTRAVAPAKVPIKRFPRSGD